MRAVVADPVVPAAVAGVAIVVETADGLLGSISSAIEERQPTVFVGLYAALYRTMAQNPGYRAHVMRSHTYPDGFGVVRELQRRGRTQAERLATTDMIHPISDLAASRSWRVGLYGAEPNVAERVAAMLRVGRPELDIVMIRDGFGPAPTVDELRDAKLDLLLVALGAGRQERYAYEVAVPAEVPAILTCGGLFDFLSGDVRRAPLWMQRHGLEWAFRVLIEPRRMFKRYLLGNAYFLRLARAERNGKRGQDAADLATQSSHLESRHHHTREYQ